MITRAWRCCRLIAATVLGTDVIDGRVAEGSAPLNQRPDLDPRIRAGQAAGVANQVGDRLPGEKRPGR